MGKRFFFYYGSPVVVQKRWEIYREIVFRISVNLAERTLYESAVDIKMYRCG